MSDNRNRDRPVIDWTALVRKPEKDPSRIKRGFKGGKARAANLSAAQLSAIGKCGAKARWG